MKTNKKKTLILALSLLLAGGVSAQTFDLSTQRHEEQRVKPVPGKKVDHKGVIINPTPHQMDMNLGKMVSVAEGFDFRNSPKKYSVDDTEFLPKNALGFPISIDYGKKVAAKAKVKNLSGAYALTVNESGVSIVGYDERGAFYGLQTLRQMLESPACGGRQLPVTTINDWPDLPNRGVVEGFYGLPWSHEVRLSLINYFGRHKMNIYLYGPKDDPYHSCPNWRLPYPEKEEQQLRELIEACKKNRVDFVWAIHPGQDIKWNEEDFKNLVSKFDRMYQLGVRSYALFFDDIDGEGTNPMKQVELINRLQKEFVKKKGDVDDLTFCPTDYSKIWADGTPTGALATYGNKMDPKVKIFWTGDYVCSDLTKETMDWFNARIKRPGYYWWNCPVTDMCRARQEVGFMPAWINMQSPAYGLDTTLTADDVCGVLSNPMEYGESSKVQLYGTADYTWNISAYNPMDAWERVLEELMPKCADAYRTFAIHSGDTETGYRRAETWEQQTFRFDSWNDRLAADLYKEFAKMEAAEAEILAGCDNALLLNEIRPWLTELTKLGQRGRKVIELGYLWRMDADLRTFWNSYAQTLMSREDLSSFYAHRLGTLKLQPFYVSMMTDMGEAFLQKLNGDAAKRDSATIANLNLGIELSKAAEKNSADVTNAFDNSTITSFTLDGAMTFNVVPGTKKVTILTTKPETVGLVQLLDADGKPKHTYNLASTMTDVTICCDKIKRIRIQGKMEVVDVLMK